MRALYLLRHAEAEAGARSGGDHARPLSARGEAAALQIGQYLRREAIQPELALCSSAERARATLTLVTSQLDTPPRVVIEASLYGIDAGGLLELLRGTDPSVTVLLVVGHNPTLHQLAYALAGEADGDALRRLAPNLPPAGLACLMFDQPSWAQLQPGGGRLRRFVSPDTLA